MNWYALRVMARREFEAADSLARRKFSAYVPMKRNFIRANRYVRRQTLRAYALMPGYVFLASPGVPEWHRVLKARYVRGVISVDSVPMLIPLFDKRATLKDGKGRSGIEDLMQREKSGEFTAWSAEKWMRRGHEFSVGSSVNIVTGPLAGPGAMVIEIGEGEAKLLMTMFCAEQYVSIGLEALEAA